MFAQLNREEDALYKFLERPPDAYSLTIKAVRTFEAPVRIGCQADGRAVSLARTCFDPGFDIEQLSVMGGRLAS